MRKAEMRNAEMRRLEILANPDPERQRRLLRRLMCASVAVTWETCRRGGRRLNAEGGDVETGDSQNDIWSTWRLRRQRHAS